jgi:hypothetical protein
MDVFPQANTDQIRDRREPDIASSSLSERTKRESCKRLRGEDIVGGKRKSSRTERNGRQSQGKNGERRSKKSAMPSSYAFDKVWKRLRLKAKQTRLHSPAAAYSPRNENWRKPNTSLIIPITGSTVHLRAL